MEGISGSLDDTVAAKKIIKKNCPQAPRSPRTEDSKLVLSTTDSGINTRISNEKELWSRTDLSGCASPDPSRGK